MSNFEVSEDFVAFCNEMFYRIDSCFVCYFIRCFSDPRVHYSLRKDIGRFLDSCVFDEHQIDPDMEMIKNWV